MLQIRMDVEMWREGDGEYTLICCVQIRRHSTLQDTQHLQYKPQFSDVTNLKHIVKTNDYYSNEAV